MSTIKKLPTPSADQLRLDRLERKIAALAREVRANKEVVKKDWYRPTEVCQMLGISRSKFEAHKRSGFFPIHKIAGGVYVSATDLSRLFPNIK